MTYTLVIGNKAYSSWSLRPWLAMRHTGIAFEEVRIPLHQDDFAQKILCGAFTIVDAMYAPVATRFATYAVAVSAPARVYVDTLLELPAMQEWYAAARAETEVLPQYERTVARAGGEAAAGPGA